MNPKGLIVLGGVLVLTAGCATEEAPLPKEKDGEEAAPAHIQSVRPENMARQVSRRPTFRWELPKRLEEATHVTFLLAEAGAGEEPVTDEAHQRRIATATGLDAASPEALDLWDPAGGCVLTGEVRDMSQLAPDTWYRWRVRAVAPGTAEHADFYFRTRETSAAAEE